MVSFGVRDFLPAQENSGDLKLFNAVYETKHLATLLDLQPVNPLMGTVYYSATPNNMKLVHWPLMGGLLQLVARRGLCQLKD